MTDPTDIVEQEARRVALMFSSGDQLYDALNGDASGVELAAAIEGALRAQLAQASALARAAALEEAAILCMDRADWLDSEIRGGGNYEHLKTRHDETVYIMRKIRALAKPEAER